MSNDTELRCNDCGHTMTYTGGNPHEAVPVCPNCGGGDPERIYTSLELALLAAIAGFRVSLGASRETNKATETILRAAKVGITLDGLKRLWGEGGQANAQFNRCMTNLCLEAVGQPMSNDPVRDIGLAQEAKDRKRA